MHSLFEVFLRVRTQFLQRAIREKEVLSIAGWHWDAMLDVKSALYATQHCVAGSVVVAAELGARPQSAVHLLFQPLSEQFLIHFFSLVSLESEIRIP